MKLKFKNPKFYPGRNITIRRGIKWHECPCKKSVLIECESDGAWDTRHTEIKTRVKKFSELTDKDMLSDHELTIAEWMEIVQEMSINYLDFDTDEIITIVEFIL